MTDIPVFSDTFFAMGTRCDVVFTHIETEFAEQAFYGLKKEFIRLENLLSRFISNSLVSELNQTPKNKWVQISDELWSVIMLCYDYFQMSNGAFDVTAAPVISLWKNQTNESGVVTEEEIQKALKRSGFQNIELDIEKRQLRFLEDGVEFDFGAIGKGIALDFIKPFLESNGIKNAIVSFGESSILALGKHPSGENWPLGIRNPFQPEEYVHVFSTSGECVTSSSGVVNDDDGTIKYRNHIISPVDGRPIDGNKSVSVKSESASLGEFLSTTWLILPENDKNILAEQLKNVEILEIEYLEENDYKTKLTIL